MTRDNELLALAHSIDPVRAPLLKAEFASWSEEVAAGAALASALVAAFPAFGQVADARPEMFAELARDGWRSPRQRAELVASLFARAGDLTDGEQARSGLRLAVQYEKLRIAARELLPRSLGGADVDTTAAEIAVLAEASIEVALAEA